MHPCDMNGGGGNLPSAFDPQTPVVKGTREGGVNQVNPRLWL